MLERLEVPTTINKDNTTAPKETSYEIICAAERKPPKKAYFELLDHPAIIILCTPKDDMANINKRLKLKSAIAVASPILITHQLVKANANVKIGANKKIIVLALFGKIDSFTKSFKPSAIGWNNP